MSSPDWSERVKQTLRNIAPPAGDEMSNPPLWANTDAQKEDRKWNHLDDVKQANDRRWLSVYGWVLVAITVVFALTFLASLLAWMWHYVGPERCHWLNEIQLSKIQSVLFSGGMGAIISGIVRSQIGKT